MVSSRTSEVWPYNQLGSLQVVYNAKFRRGIRERAKYMRSRDIRETRDVREVRLVSARVFLPSFYLAQTGLLAFYELANTNLFKMRSTISSFFPN